MHFYVISDLDNAADSIIQTSKSHDLLNTTGNFCLLQQIYLKDKNSVLLAKPTSPKINDWCLWSKYIYPKKGHSGMFSWFFWQFHDNFAHLSENMWHIMPQNHLSVNRLLKSTFIEFRLQPASLSRLKSKNCLYKVRIMLTSAKI